MDPFALLPLAALLALASIVALTFASREEPSRSRTAWLIGATVVLGVVVTAVSDLFTFFFFIIMAWGDDSDVLTAMVFIGPIAVSVVGAVLTTQGVRRARLTDPSIVAQTGLAGSVR